MLAVTSDFTDAAEVFTKSLITIGSEESFGDKYAGGGLSGDILFESFGGWFGDVSGFCSSQLEDRTAANSLRARLSVLPLLRKKSILVDPKLEDSPRRVSFGKTALDTKDRSPGSSYGKNTRTEMLGDVEFMLNFAKDRFKTENLFLYGHSMVCLYFSRSDLV